VKRRHNRSKTDVIRIGALEIENRVDRVTLMGDVELTRDREGLAKARELKAPASHGGAQAG
jgi:hypothetical protein